MSNLPLLIPSYNRPNAPLPQLARRVMNVDDYPWFVFVRKSQYRDYREFVHQANLVAVPDAKLDGVGRTRNYLLEWARREGYDQIFDWDDDIFRFGRKLEDGTRHESFKSRGNTDPWFDGPGYWEEASHLARQVFELYPNAVAGSVQNQRWASSLTVQVQCGKTPRRSKIMHVDRLLDNGLKVPKAFTYHGDDIGATALYLEYGWQVFTICNLVYDFTPETDVNLPSTLRDRDEDKNRAVHEEEFANLMQYEITEYLRVTKQYDDGTYMYGDVDWRKFRKATGQNSYTHDFTGIMDRVPLDQIPYSIS